MTLVQEFFLKNKQDPYQEFKWIKRSGQIRDAEGQLVFSYHNIEAPEAWSQLATDIAVSKYFRKSGVPGTVMEVSVRQLMHRVAHSIRVSGEEQGGYFQTPEEADTFERELVFILLSQMAAFNSPVWFNCGLYHEYKILGPAAHYRWDEKKQSAVSTPNAYQYPQCSACFIQSIEDDLMSIFELAKQEAKIFKYGSGSGTNFSRLRGREERLESGGTSSGLMSFLDVLDKGAGAIKSGGTTRRAAKMVCLDVDHPEILEFINWKSHEEKKARALIKAGYDSDFEGEAYRTVSGQNSNNSVRVSNEFIEAVQGNKMWDLKSRNSNASLKKVKAREIWREMAEAAWECADPGVQYHTTINRWHTCPVTEPIRASNPCSEYMFLDDSACNLASLNLLKFLNEDGSFDYLAFKQTVRIVFLAQEILVDFSSYPTQKICENSHDYRPLGIGYANLGAFFMNLGLPYDSDEARTWCSWITAVLTGESYLLSTEMAQLKGAFFGYKKNRDDMLRVMGLHQYSLRKIRYGFLPDGAQYLVEKIWRDVISQGEDWGFRNAQASLIAPTGTIAFLMDCDTTGIEPDFSLVKYKKLAGGGSLKIVNQSVSRALQKLDYDESQIEKILQYIEKHDGLDSCKLIKKSHLKVFDCAMQLKPLAHIEMMEAAQDFLSGAISKTVNLPQDSTPVDIEKIYMKAWEKGLKAIAIYRDGSKQSQPLSSRRVKKMKSTKKTTKKTPKQMPVHTDNPDEGPLCTECGYATVRNGNCFRCMNCGTTTGCS